MGKKEKHSHSETIFIFSGIYVMFHKFMHDIYSSVKDFFITKRVASDQQSYHKTFSSIKLSQACYE